MRTITPNDDKHEKINTEVYTGSAFIHARELTDSSNGHAGAGVLPQTAKSFGESGLHGAQEHLSLILNSISESFIGVDSEWQLVYANQPVLSRAGKTWEELKGRVLWEVFPEAAHAEFRQGFDRVMRERKPLTFVASYPSGAADPARFEVHAYPTSQGLCALISRISTQQQFTGQTDSGRLLNLVLDTAGIGMWIWDVATGDVLDLGNTARLLGGEQISSLDAMFAAVHPEDRAILDRAIASCRSTGQYEAEYRIVSSQGTMRRIRGVGSVLKGDGLTGMRIAGVLMDVTDRSRAEEARLRLAAIVDSSDDAIISKDLNGNVTSWNAAAVQLFGYTAEEMIGRSILTIIPPELQSEEPTILASLRRGEKIDHYETERVRKNGERVCVSLTISPVRDADGRIIGASKIARNITERVRMQEAIVQSEKLAATGRMAAAIAHEINNPLEAVTNLAFLLSTDPSLSDTAHKYADMLLDEIGRVSQVAKQSLAFFRDSGKPAAFNVCELLDSITRLNKVLLERKRIQIVRDYRSNGFTFGSASEIRQVFANLIRNAIDAIQEDGVIRLRVRSAPGAGQRILIADSGCGIPPETLCRLFEPFVSSKGTAGNGLGLWVSKGIVQKHGGSIKVRTSRTPGRSGTLFAIHIPGAGVQANGGKPKRVEERILS